MSSYALDFSWIYEFFDRSVPVIMVAQPDATGQPSLKNVLPNWIKTTPLLRGGRGCMHMKARYIFHLLHLPIHLEFVFLSSCS